MIISPDAAHARPSDARPSDAQRGQRLEAWGETYFEAGSYASAVQALVGAAEAYALARMPRDLRRCVQMLVRTSARWHAELAGGLRLVPRDDLPGADE